MPWFLADNVGATAEIDKSRGQRQPREISVETYPSRLESTQENWSLLPAHVKSEVQSENTDMNDSSKTEIGFFSGNPFVELTKGILHLYKEDTLSSRQQAVTLCLLAVPATMTCHDLLSFTAPCHADISHIRVIRDQTPNQYMALLTFRQHDAAAEFYNTFDSAPFNSLEPELICRAVWVRRIEWTETRAGEMDRPPAGHTELPTCPVCLERMDESVDGVLTILCNHAFHADCLLKWGDATCPVCRCVQSPELAEGGECMRCGAAAPDALWICLICGHVGCGRYLAGHAASHWRESGHCYALQLGSHRVWDYKGDNFVHRLLQNKTDGKLVSVGEQRGEQDGDFPPNVTGYHDSDEKVDSVQLEFTYLLTSQLDAQRKYFEEKLGKAEIAVATEAEQAELWESEVTRLKKEIAEERRARAAADRRVTQLTHKLSATNSELADERQLGLALRTNQKDWQRKFTTLEQQHKQFREQHDKEIIELREQIRDLMFYIDAGKAIADSADKEEIAGGTVTIGPAQPPEQTARSRRARKKR